ncbi:MAG: hypothetical protein RL349_327 [Bacteroidota bacterium]
MRLLHLSKCNNRIFVQNSILNQIQPNNPLHGVKLAEILEALVDNYGWEHMAFKVNINCFKIDPSIKSSLVFLRRTTWARNKVEAMYLEMIKKGIGK